MTPNQAASNLNVRTPLPPTTRTPASTFVSPTLTTIRQAVNYTVPQHGSEERSQDEWLLGAGYDFKVAAVSLMYQAQKNIQTVDSYGSCNFNGQGDVTNENSTAARLHHRQARLPGLGRPGVPLGAKDSVRVRLWSGC